MTSRCKTTGKVVYKSKHRAERARVTLHAANAGNFDKSHVYRCPDAPSHWHVGSHVGGDDGLTDSLVLDDPLGSTTGRWNAAQWDIATMMLWGRCRDLCDWCAKPLRGSMERHHRQRRAIGKDRLANLLALHPGCHQHITEHPAEAMLRGAIVSSYAPDPARVPVELGDGRLVLLDDQGGLIHTVAQ